MKKQRVIIEGGEDGRYNAYAPDMKNVPIGTGNTAEETRLDFLNSVKEMCETFEEMGQPIPEELKAEFDFQYDISAVFSALPFLNVSKTAQMLGINASLMRRYSKGEQYISQQRTKEIENGLHQLGIRMQHISLA